MYDNDAAHQCSTVNSLTPTNIKRRATGRWRRWLYERTEANVLGNRSLRLYGAVVVVHLMTIMPALRCGREVDIDFDRPQYITLVSRGLKLSSQTGRPTNKQLEGKIGAVHG